MKQLCNAHALNPTALAMLPSGLIAAITLKSLDHGSLLRLCIHSHITGLSPGLSVVSCMF
jgi:hypothetical protein